MDAGDLLESIGELVKFLGRPKSQASNTYTGETLNHTVGQLQQKLHTCDVRGPRGSDVPTTGSHCSLLIAASMPHVGPLLGIPGPSAALWPRGVSPSNSGGLAGADIQ